MPTPARTHHWQVNVGRWSYTTAAPNPDLAGAVLEYWEVQGELAPFSERVLPNGALELMVNLGPVHYLLDAGTRTRWDHAWCSGLHERAIAIESAEGTHLVSARLTPLGAYQLLGPAAPAAANRVVELTDLLGAEAAALVAALRADPDAATRFARLEAFLRARHAAGPRPAPFVARAVAELDAAHGRLPIGDLPTRLGVSRKHLTVSFTRTVGLPPKRYASLRRFTWTLARLQESTSVDWARLAGEAGYSDQAHLVRDFRRVAAASPTEFLRTVTPDGTALLDEATPDAG